MGLFLNRAKSLLYIPDDDEGGLRVQYGFWTCYTSSFNKVVFKIMNYLPTSKTIFGPVKDVAVWHYILTTFVILLALFF